MRGAERRGTSSESPPQDSSRKVSGIMNEQCGHRKTARKPPLCLHWHWPNPPISASVHIGVPPETKLESLAWGAGGCANHCQQNQTLLPKMHSHLSFNGLQPSVGGTLAVLCGAGDCQLYAQVSHFVAVWFPLTPHHGVSLCVPTSVVLMFGSQLKRQ